MKPILKLTLSLVTIGVTATAIIYGVKAYKKYKKDKETPAVTEKESDKAQTEKPISTASDSNKTTVQNK